MNEKLKNMMMQNRPLERLKGRDFIVYKLRKFLKKLYRGYPTCIYFNHQKFNKFENSMKILLDDGIIKKIWVEKEKNRVIN
jgi:hypothetical protein